MPSIFRKIYAAFMIRQYRGWRSILVAFYVVVGLLALCFVWIRLRIAIFEWHMGSSKILGQTSTHIIAVFGEPDHDSNGDQFLPMEEKHREIEYRGPYGEICEIEFVDNKATRINFFERG
jgi:hypothetical protein